MVASDVDVSVPNLTSYPRFAEAPKPLSLLLTPGSALFLPAGWWHAVTSLDVSISLALRSLTSCQRASALPDDLLLWLHDRGLYKKGNCVCHRDETEAHDAGALASHHGVVRDRQQLPLDVDDDGTNGSPRRQLDELLREAGVRLAG